MPAHYAVMGNPVAHSLSPVIHQLFAAQTGRSLFYEKIQIDEARFEQQVIDFFNAGGRGLNITLPCKQRAFTLSNSQSPRCLQARSANTLWTQAGTLHADNTDGVGLLRDLNHYLDLTGKTILLLGAGGAARGIIGPLLAASPALLTIANRTVEKAHDLQQEFSQTQSSGFAELNQAYDVIINATAVSLDSQAIDVPKVVIEGRPFCYDLSYRINGITPFVAWAQSHCCMAVDGLGMLLEQAAESFFIWHGVMPDTAPVQHYLKQLKQDESL